MGAQHTLVASKATNTLPHRVYAHADLSRTILVNGHKDGRGDEGPSYDREKDKV